MKKTFLLVAVVILFAATDSFSQFGNSRAILTGTGDGRNTTFTATAPCDTGNTGFAGVILANLDGVANSPFYCLDLCTGISIGDTTKDSASTIPQAIYITNTYFPARTSYPGKLALNTNEACAVQLSIWHFRNGLDPNTDVGNISGTDDALIKARAVEIINDVIANGGSTVQDATLEIVYSGLDDIYIRTLDTAGNPVAINNIALSIVGSGTLSTYNVNTDGTGNSPLITVSGASSGDEISANATLQVPGGTTYSGLNNVLQLLVLGRTTTAIRTATTTWGALPVELSSFTANTTGRDVNLNWSTLTELNNSGFDIERKAFSSDGWTKVGNVSGNGTSNVSHNYTFTDRNLSSGIFTYRLKQTDFNGNYEYHNLNGEVTIGAPNTFELKQNYPNPFNPTTTISFDLPVNGNVSLKVFNTSGKEVATLVNETRSAGYYNINFNASNLSSGVYYYRLEANGVSKVMKMALIK
jgi:hypothetical protein